MPARMPRPHYGGSRMGNIIGLLLIITIFLCALWITDMSKRDEIRGTRKELKRIADALERREQE